MEINPTLQRIKFMHTFKLNNEPTNIQQTICYVRIISNFPVAYPLWLHKVDKQLIDNMIIDVYNRVMNDYLEQKSLIPPENLIELQFEKQQWLKLKKSIINCGKKILQLLNLTSQNISKHKKTNTRLNLLKWICLISI